MSEPRISVVIATYNRAGPLDRLLEYVSRQNLPKSDFEVVVAVDGSTDHTMSILEEWGRRAALQLTFVSQENTGQAGARHAAIIRARAPRIAILDDDMEPHPGFLSEHLRAAAEDEAHAVVIGKIVPEEGWKKKPLFEAAREHYMFLLHQQLESKLAPPSAIAFSTGNVSFPTKLYFDAGGFDSGLRLNEDIDLGARLERAGGRLLFSPEAWAIHHSNIGSYKAWERRQYDYGELAVRTWEKNNRDPLLHPLLFYVQGSRLNRAAVTLLVRSDLLVRVGTLGLLAVGWILQKANLFEPAIATHKAIRALHFHLGVKHTLGSWRALTESARKCADAAQEVDWDARGHPERV